MANVINKITGQYLASVHTPDYEGDSDWIINPIQAEIDQYTPTLTLEQAKTNKIAQIDANSPVLIASGFDYNGNQMSLSPNAQGNANSLCIKILLDPDPDTNLFPRGWSKMDGSEYMISDSAEFKAIFESGGNRVEQVLDDGRALRLQVIAATTIAQVDAIEDNRS